MNETVNKYITELAPDSKSRVTSYFAGEVEEFSILIGKTTSTLQNYIQSNPVLKKDDPYQVAYGLMVKGANTIMAGFELILSGYMWDSSILFRSALEGFASAWDVAHNSDRYELWQQGKKFKSSISISNLKKVLPPVGKMYGDLSNTYVHTNQGNASPSFVVSEGQLKLQLFGFLSLGKENIRAPEVHFALLLAYVCLQIAELTFYQYSPALETLEKVPGKKVFKTKVSDRHRKFVDASMVHFQTMIDDPDSFF